MEQYSARFFKESLPAWKAKSDPHVVRYVHRPLSFYASSLFCKMGLGANNVSSISMVLAVITSSCFLLNSRIAYIAGALLVNLWLVLDCADGNIARSVKHEPFGEFHDAISGYYVFATLFLFMGVAAFRSDGLIVGQGNCWILFAGALTSVSDLLSRLIYQKFQNVAAKESIGKEYEFDLSKGPESAFSKIRKLEDVIDKEFGLTGVLMPFIIVVSVFEWFDLFLIVYSAYYVLKLLGSTAYMVKKAYSEKERYSKR